MDSQDQKEQGRPRFLQRVDDLETLVVGNLVKVDFGYGPTWMRYVGAEVLSDHYPPMYWFAEQSTDPAAPSLVERGCCATFMKFPGDYVLTDYVHRQSRVSRQTEQ